MATDTDEYAADVTDETAAYLDEVRECIALLPAAVDSHGCEEFAGVRDRLCARESAADDRLRRIRSLIGDLAPPNYTDVYLRSGEVMRLYGLIDEVPNRAERFVRDLDAVGPSLTPATGEEFAGMASLTVDATLLLTDLTEQYVGDLVESGEGSALTADVDRLGSIESDCDSRKRAVVERAFGDRPTAEALVRRDLARGLDGVADAAEDAGEHLLYMQATAL
ncbi:MAG: hypothetical protein ABEJ40_09320 [Haloarculaceae archaeon]